MRESIYDRIERYEIELEGKFSQKFYDHAIKHLNKDFNCTQCSAKLKVRKDIFRSHYISCEYCNTVNTFTPNDKIAQIRWVIDNIAKYNAIIERDAKVKAENDYDKLVSWSEREDITPYKISLKTEKKQNVPSGKNVL